VNGVAAVSVRLAAAIFPDLYFSRRCYGIERFTHYLSVRDSMERGHWDERRAWDETGSGRKEHGKLDSFRTQESTS
jgi:hypothetical protein